MDLRKLKTLIDLVSESNISELEITEAEGKVRIVKSEGAAHTGFYSAQPPRSGGAFQNNNFDHSNSQPQNNESAGYIAQGGQAFDSSNHPGSNYAGDASSQDSSTQNVSNAVTGHVAKSPMVGTFYRSSTPGGKPFIDVGSVVKEGDTICIIEAMKILNEIVADHSGSVTQILIKDGQAVEYGQSLFVIE